MDKETFIILAELATTNILMLTHDRPYRQIDGLAMGSQPAPPLSNIWLSKYEPNIRDDAKLFERYMGNTLRTIKACVCYFISNFYFSLNDSPSKTIKNVFYFI